MKSLAIREVNWKRMQIQHTEIWLIRPAGLLRPGFFTAQNWRSPSLTRFKQLYDLLRNSVDSDPRFCTINLFEFMSTFAGWWFGTCFIFHNIWDHPSHWLIIFFKMVKPTNQFVLVGIGSFIFHRCAGTWLDGWEPYTEIGIFFCGRFANISRYHIISYHIISYHIIRICSMYGIFTYMTGWFCSGKCWWIFQHHGSHIWDIIFP